MSTKYQKTESFNRLIEINEEIENLVSEADRIIRNDFKFEYNRASSYWIGHINSALGLNDRAICSMDNSINSIKKYLDEEEYTYSELVEFAIWLESRNGCSRYATDYEESIWVCDQCEEVDVDPDEHDHEDEDEWED